MLCSSRQRIKFWPPCLSNKNRVGWDPPPPSPGSLVNAEEPTICQEGRPRLAFCRGKLPGCPAAGGLHGEQSAVPPWVHSARPPWGSVPKHEAQSPTPRIRGEEPVWTGCLGRGFLETEFYCLWAWEQKPKANHDEISQTAALEEMM